MENKNTKECDNLHLDGNSSISNESERGFFSNDNSDEDDKLKFEALKYAIENNGVSISRLQRHLRIGYTKSASIVDWMTKNGYITEPLEDKRRKILISTEEYDKLMDEMNSNGEA